MPSSYTQLIQGELEATTTLGQSSGQKRVEAPRGRMPQGSPEHGGGRGLRIAGRRIGALNSGSLQGAHGVEEVAKGSVHPELDAPWALLVSWGSLFCLTPLHPLKRRSQAPSKVRDAEEMSAEMCSVSFPGLNPQNDNHDDTFVMSADNN